MDPYRHNRHEPPYPPPPHHTYPPPPPHVQHYPPPPPPHHVEHYPPPPLPHHAYPPPPVIHHVSHEPSHHQVPHVPPVVINHQQTDHHEKKYTDDKPTVRVYCKAKTDYAMTVRDGQVVLAPSNPSDPHQWVYREMSRGSAKDGRRVLCYVRWKKKPMEAAIQRRLWDPGLRQYCRRIDCPNYSRSPNHWVKDLKFSTRVKDEQGYPSFALVNKATGQAMKHSVGGAHPVQLTEYNPDKLDESVLWTESKDLGDGYRTVRMVNNIKLNVDAWNGDKNHGGVRDGTKIYLYEWKKDSNQRWTMVPY